MTPHHTPPAWALLLAELTGAGVGGHVAQTLSLLPGWVGGMLGHVAGGATQTVVLDGFRVTDLRAW